MPSGGSLSQGVIVHVGHYPGGLCLRGLCLGSLFRGSLSGGPTETPPRIRKAGGTHPTGMISCLDYFGKQ